MEKSIKNSQLPLLELDLLKTIVVIAETGNFSSAAEQLFRTPSAVSMQVKRIEELLGRTLFQRDSRSVTPTPEGELLLEHGRRLIALNNQMVSRFVMPEISGTVRLGATDDIAERLLPGLLRLFAQSHCCVTVDVVVDTTESLKKAVKSGAMDVALITYSPKKKLDKSIVPVFTERLCWAGFRNGVAYETRPLPVSVWEEGCSWRSLGLSSLAAADIDYRVSYMSAHISGQRAAILADLAIAPIPVSCCVNGIVELTEQDGLPSLESYGVGMLLPKEPSAPATAIAEHIKEGLAQKDVTAQSR